MSLLKAMVFKLWSWMNSHKANASAHHTKYTDAEAVTAVATADDYVKNIGDVITGDFHISAGNSVIADLPPNGVTNIFKPSDTNNVLRFLGGTTPQNGAYFDFCGMDRSNSKGNITLVYNCFDLSAAGRGFYIYCYDGSYHTKLRIYEDYRDIFNGIIKDPKNHAHSALSGTKKLVEIDIGGVSYYFEVYPTKA